jgi:threonine aldolase
MLRAVKPIVLRSDTVTRPTPAMREAIARAEVGDDVYGEDPTVNRLEAEAASRVGKPAAVFVPSGSMANQTSIRALTRHGDVVLAAEGAHVLRYEAGAPAALSGVQIQTLGRGGRFDANELRAAIPPRNIHVPPATLVVVENTHNTSGGRIFPFERLRGVAAVAREAGLALHLDGARLWNAVVATGIPADRWAEPFDTVSFCFSKGLGAPVGSVVCGSHAVIERVRRLRKMLGGGMRQAGVLAAAALHALEHHVERLAEDHAHARRLAEGLAELGLVVDPPPETNMVLFRVDDTEGFLRETRKRGVLVNPIAPGVLRAVTHLDVSAAAVEEALGRIADALRAVRGGSEVGSRAG